MKPLFVNTKTNEYPIYIEDSFDFLKNAFFEAGLNGKKACIITDSNVEGLYLEKIKLCLDGVFSHICHYTFQAGENSKNLSVISDFYSYFVEQKLDRKSVVIALGGGVTGDMAGFAAATFMRGIKFVQIPTTLLSQVDSSVGGKVGVDFKGGKNMIGAFYQPEFVYINSKTLATLPKKEFSAGMAEVIKYGYIIDRDYLKMLNDNREAIKNMDTNAIHNVIYGACKSKAYVVSKDEKESGLREILNFGHTFGHSIETLSEFKLLHGECVSIGMVAALYIALKREKITKEEFDLSIELLKYFDLPVAAKGFNTDEVFKLMFLDKKTKDNKINVVLINKIGEAYTDRNVPDSEIKEAIDYIV